MNASNGSITRHQGGGLSFTGPAGVGLFRAKVIASGLTLYAKTGMKPNSAYTPSAMMRCAAEITGRKFKARDYLGAAQALQEWADAQVSSGAVAVVEERRPCVRVGTGRACDSRCLPECGINASCRVQA